MKPIFRSSLFGFQKSDVVRFVAKQSSMHEAKIAELNDEIEKLRKEHLAEIEEYEQDSIALSALRDDNLKKLDTILQLRKAAEEFKENKEELHSALELSKESVAKMCDEILSLQSALDTAEGFREKAVKFDQLAVVLSGIVNGGEVKPCEAAPCVEKTVSTVDLDVAKELFSKHEKALLTLDETLEKVLQLLEIFSE